MAKKTTLNDKEKVDAHINALEASVAEVVNAIRQSILNCDTEIDERIKWNNPSFYYTGEIQAFEPKEFKREIAVFNLFKNRIMLVFPSGARIKDDSGILEGQFKDDRKTVVFNDLADFKKNEKHLVNIIHHWIKTIES